MVTQKSSEGRAEQAPTKATAWASRIQLNFPQGKRTLGDIGVRDQDHELAPALRRRRIGIRELEAARDAERSGETLCNRNQTVTPAQKAVTSLRRRGVSR